MPSHLHETLVEMFREQPALAAELLTDPAGIQVPTFDTAHVSPADLNFTTPTELQADLVITLVNRNTLVMAVIVEVQRGRPKEKKRSWVGYVASLHVRLGCPVALLVICPNTTTATWAAKPIPFGIPNLTLTPLALGPRQIP